MLDASVSSRLQQKKTILSESGEESHAPSIQTHIPHNTRSRISAKTNQMRLTKLLPVLLGGLLVLGLYGCNTPETDPATPPATPASETTEEHSDHDHSSHDHGDHDHSDRADHDHAAMDTDSPMAKMMPGLKELSPEDTKSAMAQHMCPVSDEMLGTMGTPEKVDVNGKSVWICCDGCKEKLVANPGKYLAKLNQ